MLRVLKDSEAGALVSALQIDAPLDACRRVSVAEYEELRRNDEASDRRPAPEGAERGGASLDGRAVYLGLDSSERRVYANEADERAPDA